MERRIEFEKMMNCREMGGIRTEDGRAIKKGLLIRGGTLFGASESDLDFFRKNVSMIIDFRTDQEYEEKPDVELEGIQHFRYPTLREKAIGITREKGTTAQCLKEVMDGLMKDPEGAMEHMVSMYLDMVTDEWALTGYRIFLNHLLREEDELKATFWHCTMGKDRAGIATLILLEALGVNRQIIMEDYLMTNECAQDKLAQAITGTDRVADDPVGIRVKEILLLAQREFVERLYQKVEEVYGDFESFLEKGLHFDETKQNALKARYLE